MSKSLKAILSKKSWTGEEVGRALIANLMNDIKCIGKEHEPLFSQGELDTMTNSLSEEQYNNFRPYHRLNAVLLESYNFLQAKHQQFYNGYYRLLNYLKGADAAERARIQAEHYPLILSEEKYAEIESEAYTERRTISNDLYEAVITYLSYIINRYKGGEDIPDEFRAEIERLATVQADDERVISKYNDTYPKGKCLLPTGETNKEFTPEEWKKKTRAAFWACHGIKNEEEEEIFLERCIYKGQKAYYRGKAYLIRQMKREGIDVKPVEKSDEQEIRGLLSITIKKELFKHNIPFPVPETLAGVLHRYVFGAVSPITWKQDEYTPTKQETLFASLADVLSFVARADNIYTVAYDVDRSTGAAHFVLDYYDLVKICADYLKSKTGHYYEDAEIDEREAIEAALNKGDFSSLKMFLGSATVEELDNCGIDGFSDVYGVTIYDVYSHIVGAVVEPQKRHGREMSLIWNGIAVIKDNTALLSVDGEQMDGGFFNPTDLVNQADSIEGLSADEDIKAELQTIQESLISEALRYLYAYNAFIGVLEKAYDINLEEAKAQMQGIELKIRKARSLLYTLFLEVTGSDEDRAYKQGLIKELFEDPDFMDYKPDEERIESTISKYSAQPTYRDKLAVLRTYESDILYLAEEGERYD